MKYIFLLVSLVIVVAACHSGPGNFEGGVPEKSASLAAPPKIMEMAVSTSKKEAEQIEKRNPQQNQKLIREGTLGFETKDLKSFEAIYFRSYKFF